MKLYEYMEIAKNDFDTYDTTYDAEVTVCYIDVEHDEYDKFCNGIIKKVDVVEVVGESLVINWCELIENNMEKFREFTSKYWYKDCQYEDDEDEFVYQWINEIHQYMVGNVSEKFYAKLNKLVESLN